MESNHFPLAFSEPKIYAENMESLIFDWLAQGPFLLLHADHDTSAVSWFGQYHFQFLHFPIACVILAGLAELIYYITDNEKYGFTAQFLLIFAALSSIPTVLAGLALSHDMKMELWSTLWWHRTFGLSTMILSILAAIFRSFPQYRKWYITFLVLLIICVEVTGELGSDMTFEEFRWLPLKASVGN